MKGRSLVAGGERCVDGESFSGNGETGRSGVLRVVFGEAGGSSAWMRRGERIAAVGDSVGGVDGDVDSYLIASGVRGRWMSFRYCPVGVSARTHTGDVGVVTCRLVDEERDFEALVVEADRFCVACGKAE